MIKVKGYWFRVGFGAIMLLLLFAIDTISPI